jgi:Zn-dependent protease
MDVSALLDGLLFYLCFIPVLTFHEFAHAWVAWKCGDNTAKDLGRVSLNPIVHMDMIGTVVLPLLAIYLSITNSALAGFIIGWGKPVPVNPSNLRNARRDDTLIALAGPFMNLILAVIFMGIARAGVAMEGAEAAHKVGFFLKSTAFLLVEVNLILAFFNLITVPPLDGSHVLKNIIGMSYETYWQFTRYGLLAIIVVLNIPGVRTALILVTEKSEYLLARLYGLT